MHPSKGDPFMAGGGEGEQRALLSPLFEVGAVSLAQSRLLPQSRIPKAPVQCR